ncbi:long-chain-fatty-acid--CoA ligase [Caldibacillus debilis]|jgi:long-chain acyl-CoA synthetase|uniref:Acyl-CoA synthetases (AMP-forming)/AMP-acid ligases II n=1 Tax=Caldibacillus debilis GB1 TaxID=1339248 RepID=A0A420VIM9_9BACI|nr:long-chain-fatty-acid--CoA ligase [Caldibacillus debilis]RKO63499.1 Acyl-CoA synthetases (AMP-forming)/AMP-acid ligases II [Caldibacillus debilis GB1]
MEERPWLKWYPKEIPHHLQYEEVSLQETLRRTAKKFPDRPAVHFMGKEIPYRKLFESSLKLANYLRKIGLQKGDRVAVMLPNTPQTFISFYGILFAGGIVVQVNPLFTEREIAFQLKDAGAKFIIVLDMLFNRVKNVEKETDLRHIIVTGIKDYLPFPKNLLYPMVQKRQKTVPPKVEHEGRHHLFAEIMKRTEAKDIPDEVNPKEDVAILQYTGGTTGFPKGVMLTHFNLYANAKMCDAWMYKFKEGEGATLGVLPLFHVYGLTTVLVFPVMKGDMAILLPRFDAGEVLKTIDKLKPKVFPGAPTMYIGLLNHPDLGKYDLSSIEICLSGSAPLPVEVQQQFEKLSGGKLVEGYGLTESSPVTHANFLWDNERVKGSIGVPWPDTDAKIVSLSTGETLPPGEIGELAVKGPQVMKGYWNRPEETEQALKDGWLMTGDLGYMDENGYFYIVDRKKDMIIAGGYNIYPREVEEVLYEHPAVKEAVVAGVPDPYRGETVKAYIVLKEGQRVTEEELDRFARKQLAAYKVPRIYEFRDELPKTAVGKILRRQLVEEEKRKLAEKEEKKA